MVPLEGSAVWKEIGQIWNSDKMLLEWRPLRSDGEWDIQPVWTPSIIHDNLKEVGCKLVTQNKLREVGLVVLGDMIDEEGELVNMEDFEGSPDII